MRSFVSYQDWGDPAVRTERVEQVVKAVQSGIKPVCEPRKPSKKNKSKRKDRVSGRRSSKVLD